MKLRSRLEKKGESRRRVERVKISAGPCPGCKHESQSEIYDTKGPTRYCKCNGCGETWKKTGPLANPLIDIALDAVELLGGGDIVRPDGSVEEVVLIEVKAATELANRITAALP